jgi:hypothetical protein
VKFQILVIQGFDFVFHARPACGSDWSESREDVVHLVDLLENDGRYECSCEDWEYRQKDYFLWMKPYQCKHIMACKSFLIANNLSL